MKNKGVHSETVLSNSNRRQKRKCVQGKKGRIHFSTGTIFMNTEIAKLISLGQVVSEKLKIIDKLEKTIRQGNIKEWKLQEILERAPWLINPRWQLMVADRSLKTFQESFMAWYKKKYKKEIITTAVINFKKKRPDFIFLDEDDSLIIVEIKPPKHTFDNKDWARLEKYYDAVEAFLNENPQFKSLFPNGHRVILVRNTENLGSTQKKAMALLKSKEALNIFTWEELLQSTKKDNESFLKIRDSFYDQESESSI